MHKNFDTNNFRENQRVNSRTFAVLWDKKILDFFNDTTLTLTHHTLTHVV